ncbi:MAG: hypothetical protein PHC61_08430 [Chitinivibrionales bacterium]|nr:hypothetical protein [Chitinivibrionales bacterium]
MRLIPPGFLIMGCAVFFSLGSATLAQDSAARDQEADSLMQSKSNTLGGAAWLENGQIVNGRYFKLGATPLSRQWVGNLYLDLTDEVAIRDRLTIYAGIEGKIGYDTSPLRTIDDALNNAPIQQISFAIIHAEGAYSVGDAGNPFFKIGLGLFPFKYNPDARNLGEYLFRSGTYPAYIMTGFDAAFAYLTGLRLSSDFVPGLHQSLLLTTMSQVRPFYDFSPSYIADYTVGSFLTIGAGVSLSHALSVDQSQTMPAVYNNKYKTGPADSAYYTFAGTKVMGRFSLDVQKFLPFREILGKEDLKLYGEGAILGAEKYPASNLYDSLNKINPYGYDNILRKMPIMAGFNLPGFKIIDVIAIETEWYGCRYPDVYNTVVRQGLPIPDGPQAGYTDFAYGAGVNRWKWSLYAKKEVMHGFSLIVQFASDHTRLVTQMPKNIDYEETFVKPSQWGWMAKALYNF